MIKRLFDFLVSFLAILFLAPLFCIIAVLIKFDSRGPIFFRQMRVGQYGKPFMILKFRTMTISSNQNGPTSTSNDDSRITRIGKYLRQYHLDELPQLVNILKGEMSIVGPRPQVPWAIELYNIEEKVILNVRPGLTDWATIWVGDEGERLRGSLDPDKDYLQKIWPEKRKRQLEYVRNHSLLVDLSIIFITFYTFLFRRLFKNIISNRSTVSNV